MPRPHALRFFGWLALLSRLLPAAHGSGLEEFVRTAVTAPSTPANPPLQVVLPGDRRDAGYVGSAECRECHAAEHRAWHRSYHRTMTQVATPTNVLGRFDGTEINSGGLRYRVGQSPAGLWADTPDPDLLMYSVQGGQRITNLPTVRLPVVLATGSHHYQTYWVPSPRYPGLLQTLPLVFLKDEARWVPRETAFLRGPDDQGRFITQWNHHCIVCHSTGGNPGLDEATGRLNTRVGELGISCEACHGPAERHVTHWRAETAAGRPRPATAAQGADPTIVNPARLDPRRSSQVCGQCHGVFINRDEFGLQFAKEGILYRPGEDVERTRYYIRHPQPDSPRARWEDRERNPQFFRERWWDDGTILAGGREYTALLETACHTRGQMSCLTCHSMHDSEPDDQLKPAAQSAAACVSCHREPQYTTELPRHTHHAAASTGSDCRNCHMPHTTYALLKAIRSHQISSPDARRSLDHGVPNACNLCHLDRPLAWTQDHLAEWYGHERRPLPEEHRAVSAATLWLLRGHAAQRAITAWHFGWEPAQRTAGAAAGAPLLAPLLADSYGVVRQIAFRSLKTLPGFARFEFDFLAPPAELRRRRAAVLEHWRAQAAGRTNAPRPELLQTPDGDADVARMMELWRAQDARSVTVKE
jgi:hypothetical protein